MTGTPNGLGRRLGLTVRWTWPAMLPIAALVIAAAGDGGSWPWLGIRSLDRLRVAAETLLVEVALLVIAAPLAGVALVSRRARRLASWDSHPTNVEASVSPLQILWRIFAGAVVLTAASALQARVILGSAGASFETLVVSHAALLTATIALAAFGAFCASVLRHPLDAAATAAGLAILAAAGVLVAGPAIGSMPSGLVHAALQASPVVAIAAAADVDLLRMEWLYRLSPLAHGRFDYPAWQATCGWYTVLAAGLLFLVTRTLNRQLHR